MSTIPTPNPRAKESPRAPEPAIPSSRNAGLLLSPILVSLLYLSYWQIAPRIPASSIGAIAVSTVIALALGIWLPAQLGYKLRSSAGLALASLAVSVIVIGPIVLMVVLRQRVPAPWSYLLAVPGMPFLALIWVAASLGTLLSFLVRGANMIPPIAAVLALVDIWTVLLGGPVQKIMQSEDPTAQAVSRVMTVPLATTRQPRGATPFQGSVGFADFLFVAFFTASIGRFVPSRRTYLRTLFGLIGVLSVYMLVVLFKELNLPALLPMAVTMIALHWRAFHYERSEVYALVYAAIIIVIMLLGFWYISIGRHRGEEGTDGPMVALESTAALLA